VQNNNLKDSPPRNISPNSAEDFNLLKITDEDIYGDIQEEIEDMLRARTEKKIRQARLIAFENMLGSGIERMLSVVDTMKHLHDYTPSKFCPGEKNCCQQD